MPFGLDTPSTIGMGVLVLGPAFVKFRASGLEPIAAGLETWYLGMAATATMGAMKLVLSFAGRGVQRLIPQAGLLGSLAGIALMLIGFLPLIELLEMPIIGVLTLGLVLYALLGKGRDSRPRAGRLVCSHRGNVRLLCAGRAAGGWNGDRNTGAACVAPRLFRTRTSEFCMVFRNSERTCRCCCRLRC